jgi:DNA polymerase III subunit beta
MTTAIAVGFEATVTRALLLDRVSKLAPLTVGGGTMPVLGTVMITCETPGTVHLSVNNIDDAARFTVPGRVEAPGSVCVDAKLLSQLLSRLPTGDLHLEATETKLTITSGGKVYTLVGMTAEEFPSMPAADFDEPWTLRGRDFASLIRQVAICTSKDKSRPVLAGVFLELEAEGVRMTATSGLALATHRIDVNNGSRIPADMALHTPALRQMESVFSEADHVELQEEGNYLAIRCDRGEVYIRKLSDKFPQYQRVIPKEPTEHTAEVDLPDFIEAFVRAGTVASGDFGGKVVLTFSGTGCEMRVDSPDRGQAHEDFELNDFAGEAIEIAFSQSVFTPVLKSIPTRKATFEFWAPERALVIRPMGENAPDLLCLVMPVRILK